MASRIDRMNKLDTALEKLMNKHGKKMHIYDQYMSLVSIAMKFKADALANVPPSITHIPAVLTKIADSEFQFWQAQGKENG